MKDIVAIATTETLNNVHLITHSYNGVYLITHSCGEVIDGITYDEESAKYFVDKMNEKYELSMKLSIKCFKCRKNWFETGKETCNKAEIHSNSSDHGGYTVFCVNDVNDKLNKNYIELPYQYHYQKIDVLDVKKMLGENYI